ncbi:MAG: alpha/beta fold hydrolase [Bdellovibrionales bacterium]
MKKDLQFFMMRALGLLSYLAPTWTARVACRWFLTPPNVTAPDKENLFLRSANEHKHLHGCAVWRFGQAEQKVLLIHGWAGRGAQMRYFVEPLMAMGFEVWLMDGPGHGQSDPMPMTNMARFAEALLQIAQDLGGLQAVIGHSLGGAAAVVAAGFGAPIQKLILLGSPAKMEKVFNHFSKAVGLSPKANVRFYQEVEGQLRRPRESLEPLTVGPQTQCQALILHDPKDPQVSFQHAIDYVENWPAAKLVRLEGVGHYRLLRSPDALLSVQEFLQDK